MGIDPMKRLKLEKYPNGTRLSHPLTSFPQKGEGEPNSKFLFCSGRGI